ncbi:nitrogen fixation protein [Rhodopseudomonas pseudopalustris]|uniref:NifB/NifX family molybdenum-iron cluster-binding protein n=1 Tax=Rhodopseudomonas pseudopalustris TaxID=1513892 RepID=UPI003F9988D9
MRIAVASQNFRTITGHAGMTRRFMVFEAAAGQPCAEVERIELAKDQAIHEFKGDGPHPLDSVQVVIAGSAGAGFINRMAARGIAAVTTDETDPVTAVTDYVAGRLQTSAPHAHDHEHGHDHHHDHGHHHHDHDHDHHHHDHHHGHEHGHGSKEGCCGNCTCGSN